MSVDRIVIGCDETSGWQLAASGPLIGQSLARWARPGLGLASWEQLELELETEFTQRGHGASGLCVPSARGLQSDLT